MEPFDAIYHDDVVVEWPQSGEVIRGKKNIRELRLAHPTPPTATLHRIVGSGDLWAMEMDFDYDGDPFHVILIHQYGDRSRPAVQARAVRERQPGARAGPACGYSAR